MLCWQKGLKPSPLSLPRHSHQKALTPWEQRLPPYPCAQLCPSLNRMEGQSLNWTWVWVCTFSHRGPMEQQSPAATMARPCGPSGLALSPQWRPLRVNSSVNALEVSWGCHRLSAFKPQIFPPSLILEVRDHNRSVQMIGFFWVLFPYLEMLVSFLCLHRTMSGCVCVVIPPLFLFDLFVCFL